ncbi:26S proteasome regulatory subunit N3 [Sarotherodon galilaeus]
MWYHIPNKLFNKVGGLDFLLRCDYEISKIPLKLSSFYKQALSFGKLIFTHNYSPHNSVLWNNRVIVINSKSLFKSDWYNSAVCYVVDLLDKNGNFLSYEEFIDKYKIDVSFNNFNKVCKALPTPTCLPSLTIGNTSIKDKQFNNKLISNTFKQIVFCNYNVNVRHDLDSVLKEKSFSFYLKCPLAPKMKETHFRIISGIYPVGEFLYKRFNFEADFCAFCSSVPETLEHLFFTCQYVNAFWFEIHCWVSLRISNIPSFTSKDVLFFMDNLDSEISDVVNFVIVLCKFFIHVCKWKNASPIFTVFLNYFCQYFKSLKLISTMNKKTAVLYSKITKYLLF